MKFKVIGSHKSSGDPVEMIVEAEDAIEAQHRAMDMDMAVSRVLPAGMMIRWRPVWIVLGVGLLVLLLMSCLWFGTAAAPMPPTPPPTQPMPVGPALNQGNIDTPGQPVAPPDLHPLDGQE